MTKIKRRLYELRTPSDYPGAPAEELAALLDRANRATSSAEYVEIAYGELKPTLAAAIRIHLDTLDPIVDEPSLRLLTQILHRQERHIVELPPGRAATVAFEDLGALPIRLREVRELQIMPPLDEPARDDYVEVTEEGDTYLTEDLYINGDENHVPTDPEEQKHFFHGLMDAELCAAELMARNSHEHPEMPWDFHVDMARQCWDEIRHAEVHDRLMATELDCRWGDFPIGFGYFKSIYRLDLLEPPRAVQRHERAEGDVAALAPPQGARRARPDDGRARVRLPARGRGPARPQRRALGLAPPRRRREGLPREGARAARGLGSPSERSPTGRASSSPLARD